MNDINISSTGERLKLARKAAGYKSARQFCDEHNIPTPTYSLHESGKRSLKPKVAEKYAEILGVDIGWLLTGKGLPYPENQESKNLDISSTEFRNLMSYKGNPAIRTSFNYSAKLLADVDPLLFCKIVISVEKLLNELSINFGVEQLAEKSVQIYEDILKTTKIRQEQLSMVDLSITILKRHHEEQHSNIKVNEK